MRSIRRVALTGAAIMALLGMGSGVASAQAKASAEQVDGIYFAGHGSGTLSKASGGFEAWDYDGTDPQFYYISGKVDCYTEDVAAGTAVFSATITKGDLKNRTITFWLYDSQTNAPDRFGYQIDGRNCTGTPTNVRNIEPGGYITIK